MNHLNSLLLEGSVTGPVELLESPDGSKICRFTIKSGHFELGDNDIDSASVIDVESYGKLADSCASVCIDGRGVRVVGRIKQEYRPDGVSRVYVIADHIEYKPAPKEA